MRKIGRLNLKEIEKRLADKNFEGNYEGFDMSGYGLGDTLENRKMEQDICRVNNFKMFIKRFHDVLPPNFGINDFQLHAWKGGIWWGEKDYIESDFSSWSSPKIIEWILLKIDLEEIGR